MIKKVVIIGPESTGKSTLSQQLATYFREPWVPEFARTYLDHLHRPYREEDLLNIARGQIREEEQQAAKANRLLICDTDLYVIKVWSEHKYQSCHHWILEEIARRTYDLYVLTYIDVPWVDDPQREHPQPEMRLYFFLIYLDIVIHSQVPWILVKGNEQQRLHTAVKEIEGMLHKS